jgi:hypothetical protein
MSKKSGLGSLRTPKGKPSGGIGRNETFSLEKGNAELVTKKGNQPSEAVHLGKMNVVTGVIGNVTDVVNQITQSVERVKIAKYQLEQIRVTSELEIKKGKEKTKQTLIQEIAETNRHNKQVDREIKTIEADLRKFELENSKDIIQIDNNHESKMKFLNQQELLVNQMVGVIKFLMEEIRAQRSLGLNVPDNIFRELNTTMQQLVELSSNLRQ